MTEYSDGHTFCFSCNKPGKAEHMDEADTVSERKPKNDELLRIEYTGLAKRRITEETARFWSYGQVDWHGKRVQCAQYLDNDRRVVAQKMRTPDKEFPWINRAAFKGLYGQWLWRDGGKMVVITEGEIDAMSVSQAQNNKWPVVSLPNGTGSAVKAVKEAFEWLLTFDKIILFFDNDDPGREAVDKVKRLFPPGRCWVTYTPAGYKDASDLLQAGMTSKIIDCVWGAKQYRPDGIVSGQAVIDRLRNRPVVMSHSYPEYLESLNYMTGGGIRLGELDVWTSGTGMGKTTVIKALQLHYKDTTPFNQALIHLEEPLEDTGDDLISYRVGQRFRIENPDFRKSPEYASAAEELFLDNDSEGNPRLQIYDAFGSLEDESLYDIIRYMATACGVKVFWLDHISILVSSMGEDGDERRRIDSIIHNLKSLTVELNIYIGLISHLRKPPGSGKSFEEGAVPTLDDLRGSAGIKQLANGVFAISRNQQHGNFIVKNTSTITVLKCRFTGRTGTADHIRFHDASGRLEKGIDPAIIEKTEAFPEGDSEY